MQSFSTDEARHYFTVDRGTYYLPAFSIKDIKPIAAIAEIKDPEGQASAMQEILAERARCDRGAFFRAIAGWREPREAVEALGVKQASDLFKAWAEAAKVTPGESSGSAD